MSHKERQLKHQIETLKQQLAVSYSFAWTERWQNRAKEMTQIAIEPPPSWCWHWLCCKAGDFSADAFNLFRRFIVKWMNALFNLSVQLDSAVPRSLHELGWMRKETHISSSIHQHIRSWQDPHSGLHGWAFVEGNVAMQCRFPLSMPLFQTISFLLFSFTSWRKSWGMNECMCCHFLVQNVFHFFYFFGHFAVCSACLHFSASQLSGFPCILQSLELWDWPETPKQNRSHF